MLKKQIRIKVHKSNISFGDSAATRSCDVYLVAFLLGCQSRCGLSDQNRKKRHNRWDEPLFLFKGGNRRKAKGCCDAFVVAAVANAGKHNAFRTVWRGRSVLYHKVFFKCAPAAHFPPRRAPLCCSCYYYYEILFFVYLRNGCARAECWHKHNDWTSFIFAL